METEAGVTQLQVKLQEEKQEETLPRTSSGRKAYNTLWPAR